MKINLKDYKMVADDDTAYDEVIKDINSMGHTFLEVPAQKLLTAKCKQLMRLLNDSDEEIL